MIPLPSLTTDLDTARQSPKGGDPEVLREVREASLVRLRATVATVQQAVARSEK